MQTETKHDAELLRKTSGHVYAKDFAQISLKSKLKTHALLEVNM